MITQHHHISMFSHNLKETDYFYQHVLGLRRVKISVNQNLPTMYHVFYGDRFGTAGNDFTFFDYSHSKTKVAGTNAYTGIGLLVASEASLDYWLERLEKFDYQATKEDYYGDKIVVVYDPSGLKLQFFVNTNGYLDSSWEPWTGNDVDPEHLIQGMGPVEITVRDKDKLIETLTSLFDYQLVSNEATFARLRPKADSIFGEINIIELQGRIEKVGSGTIHHLAIQLDESSLDRIEEELVRVGFRPKVYNRFYFASLYFRDHNGVMFEVVAKEAAGFLVDTNEALLGKQLDLPPFLEERRPELEKSLMPIEDWITD